MNKILFTYIISIMLFAYNKNNNNFRRFPTLSLVEKIEKILLDSPYIKNQAAIYAPLALAFFTGNKKIIPKNQLIPYKALNLYHLFTPSGLHLSSFFMLIMFCLQFLKVKTKKIVEVALLGFLSLYFYSSPGFFSLKRMLFFRINTLALKFLKKDCSSYNIFILTFGLDFIFGTYNSNALSFCYSFIFLGSILSCVDKNSSKAILIMSIMGAQVIAACMTNQSLYIPGLFCNFFISSIFTIIFPILLLGIVFPLLGNYLIPGMMIPYHYLISQIYSLFGNKATFWPDDFLIITILVMTLPLRYKHKKRFFIFYLLFNSNIAHIGPKFLLSPINKKNTLKKLPPILDNQKAFISYHPRHIMVIIKDNNGKGKIKTRCRRNLRAYEYYWRCRYSL